MEDAIRKTLAQKTPKKTSKSNTTSKQHFRSRLIFLQNVFTISKVFLFPKLKVFHKGHDKKQEATEKNCFVIFEIFHFHVVIFIFLKIKQYSNTSLVARREKNKEKLNYFGK